MRNFNLFKQLPALIFLISSFCLQAQQVITEYSSRTADSPLKVKRTTAEKDYTTVFSNEQKKVSVANQLPGTMGEDGINDVTLSIDLDFNPAEFNAPWIIQVFDESGYSNFAFYEGINPIEISVPEGSYDILAEFMNMTSGASHLIIKEQQNVAGNVTVSLNPNEADNYVSINALDENSEILQPGIINPTTGFPSEILFDRTVYFNPSNMGLSSSSYIWGAPFDGDPIWNFYVNDISDRYSIIHTFIGSGYESGSYFTKFETIGNVSADIPLENDPNTWVYHTEKFQPSDLGVGGVYPAFSTSATFNGGLLGGWTSYNTANTVNPEEAFKGFLNNTLDDDPTQFLITPAIVDHMEIIDPNWGEEGFFIKGNPIVSTNDGNVVYGSGDITFSMYFLGNSYYMGEDYIYSILPSHPKFSFTSDVTSNAKQGNNVPIIVSAVNVNPGTSNFANFNFIGRYGENRESDFFATQVEVKNDGSTDFSGDYMEFISNYSLPTSGNIEILLTNANSTLYDLDGINTTILSYNADEADAPPTLQHLQFRNADDKVTSIFDSVEGASVRIAAGDFQFTVMDDWGSGYFAYNEGNNVEFHYSIYNQDDWTELPLIEDEDSFQLPFGNYYEASLGDIDNPENDVWYDVKVICTDVAGNTQEQIISPAFKINNTLGVQDMSENLLMIYPNPFTNQLNIILPENTNGNYLFKITDLTGKTVYAKQQNNKSFIWDGSSLPKGTYILTIENNGKLLSKKVLKK